MKLKQSVKDSIKRFVKRILIRGSLFVGTAFIVSLFIMSSLIWEDDITMKEVVVKDGDTVWGLVKEENKHYTGNIGDLTNYVEMKNTIYPGEVIKIPVYKK